MHNRDRYFSNIIAKDKNFLDYKNFEFSDFDKTIDKITEDNLTPVRIGKYVESKVKNNKKIVDMTSERATMNLMCCCNTLQNLQLLVAPAKLL